MVQFATIRKHRKTGQWVDLSLEVGDIIRKASGQRAYKIENISPGSYLSVRNTQTNKTDTWDRWQDVSVVSWNDEDHCVDHHEYASWCDNCVDAMRNCKPKRCDYHDNINCEREPCRKLAPPSPPTTTDKGIMNFTLSVAKVLGGHVGQINFVTPGKESTVVWQSEPQKGTTEVDGAKMTAEARALFMAEEELAARIGNLFS